jgi:glucose/arabinose dehydrogenase
MRRIPPVSALARAIAGLFVVICPAWALPPGYLLQQVQAGLDYTTTIRFAPDGRLFYAELFSGRIMVLPNGTASNPTVWATVPIATGGEHGLLGMTFHPQFPDSPYVYVFHSRPSPVYNRIARLRDQNGLGVDYTVLVDSLYANGIVHFGGRLAFGPGLMLYVTSGDCGFSGAPQDPSNTLGKILRYGSGGEPATGNSFGAGSPVCALGVRNPFGLCFDAVTGYGYFTDNGTTCDDEVNRMVAGVNYGWGSEDFCGGQPPGSYEAMVNLTPTVGLTGCAVYRGAAYPGYNGNLFMGNYTGASVQRVVFHSYPSSSVADTVETWATLPDPEAHVIDVTQGTDGRIWFATFDQIWRVLEPPNTPVSVDGAPLRTELKVAPNPSSGSVRFELPEVGPIDGLEIVDVAGRRVRAWSGPLTGTLMWDGRDEHGRATTPGVYWVRTLGPGPPLGLRLVRFAGSR